MKTPRLSNGSSSDELVLIEEESFVDMLLHFDNTSRSGMAVSLPPSVIVSSMAATTGVSICDVGRGKVGRERFFTARRVCVVFCACGECGGEAVSWPLLSEDHTGSGEDSSGSVNDRTRRDSCSLAGAACEPMTGVSVGSRGGLDSGKCAGPPVLSFKA